MVYFTRCSDDGKYGRVQLYLTDSPIDAANVKAVVLTVNRVDLKGSGGWQRMELDTPVILNILDYQNGNAYFVTEETISAGTYNEVRLILDAPTEGQPVNNPGCYIEYLDDTKQALFIPSGASSGYKVKGSFTLPADGTVAVTLDFDVRQSIVEAGASEIFLLKPTVRMVANEDAALIEGNFAEHAAYNKVVVYAYEKGTFNVSEADEPAEGEVRFSNAVTSSAVMETGDYTLAFLQSGEYDLVLVAYNEEGEFVELIGKYENVSLAAGAHMELDLMISLLVDL
jgi:hypothetical protein